MSAHNAVKSEVRLYDQIFNDPAPMDFSDGRTLEEKINPDSLVVMDNAYIEPYAAVCEPHAHFQFLRSGFFTADNDYTPERPVFNRTVGLKDTWGKKK